MEDLAVGGHLAVLMPECPDAAGDIVSVDVRTVEPLHRLAAIDEAARDRHADDLSTPTLRVLDDRVDQRVRRKSFPERMHAFADPPSVVAAPCDEINLLPRVLPDVTRPQVAGRAIEAHAPDVPQPVRPDLAARAQPVDEGIVLGDGVPTRLAVDVQTQDGPQQRAEVLAVLLGVVGGAAVTEAHVQVTIRAEQHGRAVVVAKGLGHLQNHDF